MTKLIKLNLALIVIVLSIFGIFFLFNLSSPEALFDAFLKVMGGLAILFISSLLISSLSSSKSEPEA